MSTPDEEAVADPVSRPTDVIELKLTDVVATPPSFVTMCAHSTVGPLERLIFCEGFNYPNGSTLYKPRAAVIMTHENLLATRDLLNRLFPPA